MVSQRSFGAKSNLTTPMRTERSGVTQKAQPGELSQKDSEARRIGDVGSHLKKPTRMTKSPSTKAILKELDQSRTRLNNQFNLMTVSTQNELEKFGQEA